MARATAKAPQILGSLKYNEYTRYSHIVGFVLVVFRLNIKQTMVQICHGRGNVLLGRCLSIQSADRNANIFASAVTARHAHTSHGVYTYTFRTLLPCWALAHRSNPTAIERHRAAWPSAMAGAVAVSDQRQLD